MLLNKDTNPKRDLYYIGAIVIQHILEEQDNLDIASIYQNIKNEIEISFNLFTQTLDWLYILDIIDFNEKKVLIRCS